MLYATSHNVCQKAECGLVECGVCLYRWTWLCTCLYTRRQDAEESRPRPPVRRPTLSGGDNTRRNTEDTEKVARQDRFRDSAFQLSESQLLLVCLGESTILVEGSYVTVPSFFDRIDSPEVRCSTSTINVHSRQTSLDWRYLLLCVYVTVQSREVIILSVP